ncbi:alpha-1,4-glucan--maltose-1-phosphate maltosyltransferase [Thiohalomonas denitrificans]|uniref:Alpha-1,4-glucan:maltose-1-phosphate maltosyltransferase n=1 Tax=Thiohalomonas denitrificans TaxID=415747 RepID=A0A1G5Q8V0_9GAMM|nr:alpha-1,4-glucan--maltose-1-phosphate maltosyltransferase [Thiohalomonas denitrificans]SCZ57821.1 alpha-1,4-glucan:maltose-1-phosphate maltosyltransferase [Thiohalomonas denitrificans]
MKLPENDGRRRVVIEGVTPQVDDGCFPVKRTIGETVAVEANCFTDGHDLIDCVIQYRHEGEAEWHEVPMSSLGHDRWSGEFPVTEMGRYRYRIQAWVDRFLSWRHDLRLREDSEDIGVALQMGADLVEDAAGRASGHDAERLHGFVTALRGHGEPAERRVVGLDTKLLELMERYADRRLASLSEKELAVVVEREKARFSAWYEFFPRSCGVDQGKSHGGFRDCEERLAHVASMNFDVVYLPPIHPVGESRRKGPNNSLIAGPEDPGSPWAIGSEAGGHKSVHPQLGTLEDFRHFRTVAEELGLEVAIDIAFQCSPDHPYVTEHPEWFLHRPDGSVQYAENPPKKYQDIYPFHFEAEEWHSLWEELHSVLTFWVDQGVTIFRVDNPHTKPFPFWEWVIAEVKREHPDVLFLSEAFARPNVMYRLAKIGFSQSYTYFTWRNTKWELTRYMQELTRTEVREFFRPNFWPTTPDILPEYLQFGGRPAFSSRLVLAATLAASYGVYGPAFELAENRAVRPGSEEYLDSEKYQTRHWDVKRRESLADYMRRVNTIRRENEALQANHSLEFFTVDNEEIIAYGKTTRDLSNIIVVVVNLDAYHTQSGWVELPMEELEIDPHHPYQMHDLLSGSRYLWHGPRNYVELDPQRSPAHIFRLYRRTRTEHDFEYFF